MGKIKKIIIYILANIGIGCNLLVIYFLIKIFGLNLGINHSFFLILIIIFFISNVIFLIIFFNHGNIIKKRFNVFIVDEDISSSIDNKIKYIQSKINKLNKKFNLSVQLGIYEDYDIDVFTILNGTKGYLISFSTGMIENMDINKLDGIIGYEYIGIKKGTTFLLNIFQGFLNIFIINLSYFFIKLIINLFKKNTELKKSTENFFIFVLDIILGLFINICIFIILKIKYNSIYLNSIKKYTDIRNILYALQKIKIYSEDNNNYFDKKEVLISSLKFNISKNINIGGIPYHGILDNRIKNILELIK